MKKTLLTVLVVAMVALSSVSAFAQDNQAVDPKVESQVVELINSFHHVPTKKDWDAIGPEAADVLRAIASDRTKLPTVRARAISSLAHFEGQDNQAFLASILKDEAAPIILRRKAVRVLALSGGEGAVEVIKPLAAHDNARLRESAIRALGAIETDAARAVLAERLQLETKKYLKDEIQLAIQKIDKKP